MKDWPFFSLRPTRYSAPQQKELGVVVADAIAMLYGCQAPGLWRVVVRQGGSHATVGQQYVSETELLHDLPRYAEHWGFRQ